MSAVLAPTNLFNGVKVSTCEKGDCKEAANCWYQDAPLERASLSGKDSWCNESDECCHSDPRRLSSKSLVLTSDYHLRTEDDDWTSYYSLTAIIICTVYMTVKKCGRISDYIFSQVLISE